MGVLAFQVGAEYVNNGGPRIFFCDTPDDLPLTGLRKKDTAIVASDGSTRIAASPTSWVDSSWGEPSGSIPAGCILMWSGLLQDIPSGWALCDGQNGTPDLRSKFTKGASAGQEPGGEGGSSSHLHTYSQVPNHIHPITDPGHAHTTQRYPTATGGSSGFTIDTSMSGTPVDNTLPTKSSTTGIVGTQNPTEGVGQGQTNAASSEPSYYSVAFIMKT